MKPEQLAYIKGEESAQTSFRQGGYFMPTNQPWMDITDKVEAKIESGILQFYHNHDAIGQMNLETREIRMDDGFRLENGRVYAENRHDHDEDRYADQCDLDWCQ